MTEDCSEYLLDPYAPGEGGDPDLITAEEIADDEFIEAMQQGDAKGARGR